MFLRVVGDDFILSAWHNDDGGCVYTNVSLMNELQASLEKKFAMKRVDEPVDYLGLLVERARVLKRVEIIIVPALFLKYYRHFSFFLKS